MRATFALRDRSAVTLVLGRKDRQLKAGVRKLVKEYAEEAHAIAYFLSAYRTGRMQRLLKIFYTPARFGFDLGWSAAQFRAEGVFFYPPRVVLGLGQRAQDNLTPAWTYVRPRFQRAVVRFGREWAAGKA